MLISIIVSLVILGLLLWLVDMLPIDGRIKTIINVVVIIAIIIWLLQIVGVVIPIFKI